MEIKIKLGVNTTYISKIQKIFVKILHKKNICKNTTQIKNNVIK